jgi:hypothetical protein
MAKSEENSREPYPPHDEGSHIVFYEASMGIIIRLNLSLVFESGANSGTN